MIYPWLARDYATLTIFNPCFSDETLGFQTKTGSSTTHERPVMIYQWFTCDYGTLDSSWVWSLSEAAQKLFCFCFVLVGLIRYAKTTNKKGNLRRSSSRMLYTYPKLEILTDLDKWQAWNAGWNDTCFKPRQTAITAKPFKTDTPLISIDHNCTSFLLLLHVVGLGPVVILGFGCETLSLLIHPTNFAGLDA